MNSIFLGMIYVRCSIYHHVCSSNMFAKSFLSRKQPVFVGNISLLKSLWQHTAGCLTNLNTRWNEPNEKVHLRENMRNCPQLTVLNSRMPNWHPNFCWPKTMATGTCFKPPRRDLEQRWTVADLVATCRSRRYGYGRNLKPLWFHQKTWGFNKHQ